MSLVRQLWLAISLITATIFAGAFMVSMLSASSYLEQELQRKNMDNANSLALSMSQQTKDEVTVELQVAALFDSGHYQSITVYAPDKSVLIQRIQERSDAKVPEWFVRLFPIQSIPGQSQISDGWKQFGTIVLISHNRFAHQALWHQAWSMLMWFTVIGLLSGLIGMLALRTIKRPLEAVVDQAKAISERRFLTIAEPKTPELKSVVRAMNDMVGRVKNMFLDEARRLDSLQQQINFDSVTGLGNRDYFMGRTRELLSSEKSAPTGVLLLLRLTDLGELNTQLGHAETDRLLKEIGNAFKQLTENTPERLSARLKGADFALLAPSVENAQTLAQQLSESLTSTTRQKDNVALDLFHIGAVPYSRGAQLGSLLTAADQALAIAENKGANTWHAEVSNHFQIASGNDDWRELLNNALANARLKLVMYPVNNSHGELLHQEGMVRLQAKTGGDWLSAGDFMPMAARLELTGPIDLSVVQHALIQLKSQPAQLAINLASETIADWKFRNDLSTLLRNNHDLCTRLWFEVGEYGAIKQYEAFRDLCSSLKQLGCKVGIEHFGHHLHEVQKLSDLGLDYFKLDASLARNIDQNAGNQKLIKGLCRMAHSIGTIVIAVGVKNQQEQDTLLELGIDGLTGPAISKK